MSFYVSSTMAKTNTKFIKIYSESFELKFQNKISEKIKILTEGLIEDHEKYLTGFLFFVRKPKDLENYKEFECANVQSEARCFKIRNNILSYDNFTTVKEASRIKYTGLLYMPEQMVINFQKL